MAAHRDLPPPSYCKVDGDEHVLAGVEIEVPGSDVLPMPQIKKIGPLRATPAS